MLIRIDAVVIQMGVCFHLRTSVEIRVGVIEMEVIFFVATD